MRDVLKIYSDILFIEIIKRIRIISFNIPIHFVISSHGRICVLQYASYNMSHSGKRIGAIPSRGLAL